MSEKLHISQDDNYKKNFGIAYRSSTIFYFKKSKEFNTIVNFMDYWKIKKSIDVMIIASLRDMSGKLIFRERISFDKGFVINYTPEIDQENFEGSLEMEAIANGDLGIPYAAMLVIYEAKKSISWVHGYTRTYSPHEIEEGKIIESGEEAGLVCRDTKDIRSFIIGHNGINTKEEQVATLWVSNIKGEIIEKKIKIKELNPFETFIIYPSDHINNLIEFLDGSEGNVAISFKLKGGFTRTVVGNELIDGSEFQVYHSNFNYGRHDPGYMSEKEIGYYSYPFTPSHEKQITHLDSFCAKGNYEVITNNKKYNFKNGHRKDINMDAEVLSVRRTDGEFPKRLNIVLSAFLKGAKCKLPMESARGFYHSERPPKYRMWMSGAIGKKYRSKIIIHALTDLYGPVKDSILTLKLYREKTFDIIEKKINGEELKKFEEGVYVDELFPEQANQSENEICQIWGESSSYGGLQAYTTIENSYGSASIEHNY